MLRPQKAALVGSYMLRTTLAVSPSVDVALCPPAGWAEQEQLRRHGWLTRRSDYLSSLAAYLAEPVVGEVFGGKLRVRHDTAAPGEKSFLAVEGPGGGWEVRLHCALLLPQSELQHFALPSTVQHSPHYSQAVLEDALSVVLAERSHGRWARTPVLCDCALLLKLWALKQGLSDGADGLHGRHLTLLLCHLADSGRIMDSMGSAQAFRIALQFLSALPESVDLAPPSEVTLQQGPSAQRQELLGMLSERSPTLMHFLGHSTWYQVSPAVVKEAGQAARAALKLLDSATGSDAIAALFQRPSPFWLRYDVYCRAPWPKRPMPTAVTKQRAAPDALLTMRADFAAAFQKAVTDHLPGLAVRIRHRDSSGGCVFGIGLETADSLLPRVVEGPPLADKPACAAFKEVWGAGRTRSLQRADGVVRLCAVFDAEASDLATLQAKLSVLLERCCGCPPASAHVLAAAVQRAVQVPADPSRPHGQTLDTAPSLAPLLQQAFMKLTTYLMDLSDFPVRIVNVNHAHAGLRGTAVAPPRPHANLLHPSEPEVASHLLNRSNGVEPVEVVIEFEHSSVWPDHLEAVRALKAAFYCRIAARLRKERRSLCLPREDCVDVLVTGFVFRCYIHHPREVLLLEALGQGPAAAVLNKQLNLLPQHAKLIRACLLRWSSFGAACRLLKRWAAAHMLHGYVTDEALELLVAHVYAAAANPPCTPAAGFVRSLHLLESWDWEDKPLVVPSVFGEDPDLARGAQRGWRAAMESRQRPAMYISGPYCPARSPFTEATPSAPLLRRARSLARAALELYFKLSEDPVGESWEEKWGALFAHSMKPYHFLLTLDWAVVPDALHHLPLQFSRRPVPREVASTARLGEEGKLWRKGAEGRYEALHMLVGYAPVPWLLGELRKLFRESLMFCYDPYGGAAIAAVGLRKLTPEEGQLVSEHCQRLGAGIIHSVQVSQTLMVQDGGTTPVLRSAARQALKRTGFSPAARPATPPSRPSPAVTPLAGPTAKLPPAKRQAPAAPPAASAAASAPAEPRMKRRRAAAASS
eukprot:TRINITY_DN16536_c0_g1_i2.p1 TRINITY_DN16536_c0_g1~~TRINITY_DN16536_c0_g1_i2.p1  ORF type:complete len:1118 (+),score=309.61 TRINITY_DN16536_c0_g1_i2:241-3354(+)